MGVRIFEALHQTSPVREQEQQVWERRRSQVELTSHAYMTRSVFHFILHKSTFFRSLFSVIHGEWHQRLSSILRLIISDWTLGEDTIALNTISILWFSNIKMMKVSLTTLPVHIWKIPLWLIKNVHNRHLKKIQLFSNSLMLNLTLK